MKTLEQIIKEVKDYILGAHTGDKVAIISMLNDDNSTTYGMLFSNDKKAIAIEQDPYYCMQVFPPNDKCYKLIEIVNYDHELFYKYNIRK